MTTTTETLTPNDCLAMAATISGIRTRDLLGKQKCALFTRGRRIYVGLLRGVLGMKHKEIAEKLPNSGPHTVSVWHCQALAEAYLTKRPSPEQRYLVMAMNEALEALEVDRQDFLDSLHTSTQRVKVKYNPRGLRFEMPLPNGFRFVREDRQCFEAFVGEFESVEKSLERMDIKREDFEDYLVRYHEYREHLVEKFGDLIPKIEEPDDEEDFLQTYKLASLGDIMESVCRYSEYDEEDIISSKRSRGPTHSRHVFCYLARVYTCKTYTEIGAAVGKREHTTVMYGVEMIAEAVASGDTKTTRMIACVERDLESLGYEPVQELL